MLECDQDQCDLCDLEYCINDIRDDQSDLEFILEDH